MFLMISSHRILKTLKKSYLMVRMQIHLQPLLVTNGGVVMVQHFAEINDIDNGDDTIKVLHDVDGYAVNGMFIE